MNWSARIALVVIIFFVYKLINLLINYDSSNALAQGDLIKYCIFLLLGGVVLWRNWKLHPSLIKRTFDSAIEGVKDAEEKEE